MLNDDGTVGIADYDIDDEVIEVINANNKFAGTHDFIVIWAYGHGADRVPYTEDYLDNREYDARIAGE